MDTTASGKTKPQWLTFGRADFLGTKLNRGIAVTDSTVVGIDAPIADADTNTPSVTSMTFWRWTMTLTALAETQASQWSASAS